jgi:hypothetical protein
MKLTIDVGYNITKISFLDRTSPLYFKYTHIKKRSMITFYTQLYLTCENSYMFRLYICSHHQTGYRNLSQKNYKIQYNTTVRDEISSLHQCTIIRNYIKVHEII